MHFTAKMCPEGASNGQFGIHFGSQNATLWVMVGALGARVGARGVLGGGLGGPWGSRPRFWSSLWDPFWDPKSEQNLNQNLKDFAFDFWSLFRARRDPETKPNW